MQSLLIEEPTKKYHYKVLRDRKVFFLAFLFIQTYAQ